MIDEAAAGAPDLDAARTALPVLAADRRRSAKTVALHGRLLARMRDGAGPSGPDGGSDWDPAPEEARLRRAEART